MLAASSLSKAFPGVQALDSVSMEFRPGQVHAVIGENGAGKSTLMKILAGVYQPDSGSVQLDGKAVSLRSVDDALRAGIAMIHQELNLIPTLSIADNLFLGREMRRGLWLDVKAGRAEAARLLARVSAKCRPEDLVAETPLAQQQLVEVAKAVSTGSQWLIFDEPTAVLSQAEVEVLFDLIDRLKAEGKGIIYISHHLSEIRRIADVVTVMRDGKVVATADPKVHTEHMLACMMVGREIGDFFPAKPPEPQGGFALEVHGLGDGGVVKDVSFGVRPGEILGLAGLVGCGRTETAEMILGARPSRQGRVILGGREAGRRTLRSMKRLGLCYVSEDRKGAGLHQSLPSRHNTTLATLEDHRPAWLDVKSEKAAFDTWVQRLQVKVSREMEPISSLSGGNQQKLSLAKWLKAGPKVLILDEPTRGVDVGAKRELYDQIASLAGQGLACVVISSELSEIIGLCHRVVVLHQGRSVGEVSGSEVREDKIMLLASGLGAAA